MEALHETARSLVDWLLETSVQVAVLVAAILAAQLLLRRWLTPRWRYGLWLLVPVRLVMPVLPPSPVSVFNAMESEPLAVATAPAEIPVPPLDLGPSPGPADPVAGADLEPPRPEPSRSRAAPELAGLPQLAAPPPTPAEPWPWETTLAAAWLLGAGLFGGFAVLRELRFRLRLRTEPVVTDLRVTGLLQRCADELGVRRRVKIVRTTLVETPALTGVLRPRLLLPARVLTDLPDRELAFVFRHELAHLLGNDPLVNWLLTGVQAVHWVNPVAWFALWRLRVNRETARDWTALSGQPEAARGPYGRTLIGLLEGCAGSPLHPAAVGILAGRHDLRRRITMITKFRDDRFRGLLAGALVAGVLSGVMLTGAAVVPVVAQEAPNPPPRENAEPLLRVRVERQQPVPRWERVLREKLAKKVTVKFVETPLTATLEFLRGQAEINIVMAADAQDDAAEAKVEIEAENIRVDHLLGILLPRAELGYSLTDGAVYVGRPGELPARFEQRFYDVRPLLEPLATEDMPQSSWADVLEELIRQMVWDDTWEEHGAGTRYWEGLLVVDQTDAMHARVETFVNLLLNRGREAEAAPPEWVTRLDAALARPANVNFLETPLPDVVEWLEQVLGQPVVLEPEADGDELITLALADATNADVVRWIAHHIERRVVTRDGALVLARSPSVELRCYEIGDLVALGEEEGPTAEEVMDLLRESVLPASWEEEGVIMALWGDLLLVSQSEDVHGRIDHFFASLRRALDR